MYRYLVLALLFTFPALAAEPPTLDMTTVIIDEFNKPVKDILSATPEDKTCEQCPILTIGHAISHALNSEFRDEPSLGVGQKRARSILGQKVWEAKAANLNADEIAVIKKCVGKLWSPSIVRQIIDLLDPNDVPEKVKP